MFSGKKKLDLNLITFCPVINIFSHKNKFLFILKFLLREIYNFFYKKKFVDFIARLILKIFFY